MSLDENLARAQHTLAVVQRAVHHGENWTAVWANQSVPVTIEATDSGVTLLADFDDAPADSDSNVVSIFAESDLLLVHERDACPCGDPCGFSLRWDINLKTRVPG